MAAAVGSQAATARSDSWLATQRNVERIFNDKFRTSSPERAAQYPTAWAELSERLVCCYSLYDDFAKYIAFEYKIEKGEYKGNFLSAGSVLDYLGCLIQIAANKHRASGLPETRLFFTCQDLNGTTDSARWLRGLRNNLQRDLFQRAMENGEKMDKSAYPLCLPELMAINQAYAREGSEEVRLLNGKPLSPPPFPFSPPTLNHQACKRKFAVQVAKAIAGRSSEASFLTWNSMSWSEHFNCLFGPVPQGKVSKIKFVGGSDPNPNPNPNPKPNPNPNQPKP